MNRSTGHSHGQAWPLPTNVIEAEHRFLQAMSRANLYRLLAVHRIGDHDFEGFKPEHYRIMDWRGFRASARRVSRRDPSMLPNAG